METLFNAILSKCSCGYNKNDVECKESAIDLKQDTEISKMEDKINYLQTDVKIIKNDILEMLGPPSTKSNFDNDLWIYIERKHKNQSIFKLGAKKIDVNNIIILEIDNRGLLVKKDLYDKDDMNALKFSNDSTNTIYRKDQFIYNFLSSLRQKVNDPLGKRKKGGNRRDNTN